MEEKLKSFLQDIQSKVAEAIAMCDGEEAAEEEAPETEVPMQEEGDPMEKGLRKEKL